MSTRLPVSHASTAEVAHVSRIGQCIWMYAHESMHVCRRVAASAREVAHRATFVSMPSGANFGRGAQVDPCPIDHVIDLEGMSRTLNLTDMIREYSFLSNPRTSAKVPPAPTFCAVFASAG
eukprot:6206683-Pleurochrysis_carterae.AAC.1